MCGGGGTRIAPSFLIFWQQRRDIGQLHVSGADWVVVWVGPRAGGTVWRGVEFTTMLLLLMMIVWFPICLKNKQREPLDEWTSKVTRIRILVW